MPSPTKKKVSSKKKVKSVKAPEKEVVIRGNYVGKNFDPNFAAKFYKSIQKTNHSKDLERLGNLALLGGSIGGIIFLLDRLAAKKGAGPVQFVSASVDTAIDKTNIGYKMLAKKGYSGGGRSPIKPGTPNKGSTGLGF